jgi:hypothetical protein
MKFQLMQIHLTNDEVDAINKAQDHGVIPKNKMRIAMQMDFSGSKTAKIAGEAMNKGFYTHVANIEANDLDEVFEIGNIGPESAIERTGAPMCSVSVGDVIVDEAGNASVVASFGFQEVA